MNTAHKIIVSAIAFLSITLTFAQSSDLKKELKIYERVWHDILNKGDIDLINEDSFSANIIQINNEKNIVGIKDFKAYYQNFITGFSDINFSVIDVFGQNNKILKHWRFKGRHTGDFFGIPATGKQVNIEGVTLVKMKDGKIAEEQDFMDNSVMMQQLGLESNAKNVYIIDDLYNAFASGNIQSVLNLMDAKVIWNEAESNSLAVGNPYVGPDAILNGVFAPLSEMYEGFRLKNIKLHDMSNDQVLATLRYDATVKATGKKIDVQAAHLWTLNDGKITAFQQYVDTKKLADSEQK